MNEAELAMQDTLTRAFILADPEDIELHRTTKVSNGAGGFTTETDPEPLNAQTFRLVPQSDKVQELVTSDGTRAKPVWVILGSMDSDMERYDMFEWRGDWWEIAEVHTKPDYERKGDVVPRGRR